MKRFSKLILEASRFESMQVEDFLVSLVTGAKNFEFFTVLREDPEGGWDYGKGDFYTCAKRLVKSVTEDSSDVYGCVVLQDSKPGNRIALKYDPKTNKWSLDNEEI